VFARRRLCSDWWYHFVRVFSFLSLGTYVIIKIQSRRVSYPINFCKVYLLVGFLGSNACWVVYVNDLNWGLEPAPFCGHRHVFLLIAKGSHRCQILIIDMLALSGGTYRIGHISRKLKCFLDNFTLFFFCGPARLRDQVVAYGLLWGCWNRYSYRVTTGPT